MAAEDGLLLRSLSAKNIPRPVLNHMTDTEVVERHRLSTGRLNWLIERCIVQKIDLDRQQFTETQVNQYRLIVKTYPPTFGAVKLLMLIY